MYNYACCSKIDSPCLSCVFSLLSSVPTSSMGLSEVSWAFMFGCGRVWILGSLGRYELSVIGQNSAWNAPSLSRNVGITPW